MGPERAAVIRSRGVAAKQGFLMYHTKGVATGPRSVSAIERVSGVSSGGGGGGLRGLQPPVSESSSAANVCLSTLISLLLVRAIAYVIRSLLEKRPLYSAARESLVIAGVLPVLLCILNREGRTHATPFHSLA